MVVTTKCKPWLFCGAVSSFGMLLDSSGGFKGAAPKISRSSTSHTQKKLFWLLLTITLQIREERLLHLVDGSRDGRCQL